MPSLASLLQAKHERRIMVLKEVVVEDDPNLALASRKKGKRKQRPSFGGEVASGSKPNKDMFKIKCYVYREIGNYAC